LEGERLQIARRSSVAPCEVFLENPNFLSTSHEVRWRASEVRIRLFLAAIEGATTEIGMANAIDVKSLSSEFQFVKLIRLPSAMSGLPRQLARQNRELGQLAEANGRARAERDSQLEALRGAISDTGARRSRGCRRRWAK
jgi:hypothetical protein